MRFILAFLFVAAAAIAQTLPNAVPMPTPEIQYLNAQGKPLAGAFLCTYAAGTTTPQATYTDSTAGTPNSNPIVLDVNGRASVWIGPALYKFVLYVGGNGSCPGSGAVQWTQDNVSDTTLYFTNFVKTAGACTTITFTATGTGAVSRTCSSKLGDIISVQDYGAVGDGSTDDGPAFNRAFVAAAGLKATGVIVPAANYYIATQAVLSQNGVGLYCATGAVLINHVSSSSNRNAELVISGTNNRVEGCTFDANSVALGSGTAAVIVQGATNVSLSHLILINVVNYGISAGGSTAGLSMDHIVSPSAVLFSAVNVSVTQSAFYNLGIIDSGSPVSNSITVTGNTLHADPTVYNNSGEAACLVIGDFSAGKTYPPSSFTVTGNTCEITGTTGSSDVDSVFACYSIVNVTGGTFAGNTCHMASGQYVQFAGLELGCVGCSVVGNTFTMPDAGTQQYNGIISYGPATTISANTVSGWGNHSTGIAIDPQTPGGIAGNQDNIVISSNTLTNPTATATAGQYNAISIVCGANSGSTSYNDSIVGNTINSTVNRAINIQNGGCPVSAYVTGNTVANAAIGVYLYDATVSLGPNRLNNVATPISANGTNTIETLTFRSPISVNGAIAATGNISGASLTATGLVSVPSLATDSGGDIIAGSSFIQGEVTFTPSGTGWYRLLSGSVGANALVAGTAYIFGYYNGHGSPLTVDFVLNSSSAPSTVTLRGLAYYGGNFGFIQKIEASGNGSDQVYLDVYISTATSPGPVTVVFTGPGVPAGLIVPSPVSGATPGADSVAIVDLTNANSSLLPSVISTGSPVFGGAVATPASSAANCIPGQWAFDSSYLYTCTAANTWRRVGTSSF